MDMKEEHTLNLDNHYVYHVYSGVSISAGAFQQTSRPDVPGSTYTISAPFHCQNCGFPENLWHTLLASILQRLNSKSFLLLLYIRLGYPLSHTQFIRAALGP